MRNKKLSAEDTATLLLLIAFIFGTWLRLMPARIANFPLNDGGMFYTMIQDLQANHYVLPLFTSYNHLNIPFVYPPLGFYIGAAITDLFKLSSPLLVIQFLPGLLNSLCIPAFYLLAKEISGDKLQSAISTLVFSFIPHMTAWFSMGGGLTRALGAIFMLFALAHIYRVFSEESNRDIWGSIIFSSLAILSHTEAPIYTIAIAIFIWAIKSHSINGIINGFKIAIGTLVLTSPWIAWIINKHGLAPFISASQTNFRSTWSLFKMINISFITEEPYLGLLGAMGIIGMAILVSRKNFTIPGIFVMIFLSNPRSAHTIGNIPLAMAAGFLIADILIPTLSKARSNSIANSASHQGVLWFLVVLIPYILSNSLYYEITLSKKHVPEPERNAMQWISKNTPAESIFLVITGEQSWLCDSTSEWFPALTNRQSIATLQGNEWLKGKDFSKFAENYQALQACRSKGYECILKETEIFTSDFNYIFISTASPTLNCNLTDASNTTRNLILDLELSPRFQSVFMSTSVSIFMKKTSD